ncbi:hypothetical protein PMAYCL1PPCAC_26839, partial [Pristionchus mayeri]
MHSLALAILLSLHSPLFAASPEYKVVGPLTQHFQDWLKSNGYTEDFVRADHKVTQGSYGGKTSDAQNVTRTPVIMIHGNSDAALRQTFGFNSFAGWENTIDYFLQQGYTSAELYATSWGDTNQMKAEMRRHDCKTVQFLRRFMEAVKAYTGSEKVHIIAHSMGVTLGRKITLGGKIQATDGNCDIGVPYRYVDVFVGISGANYGLCNCAGMVGDFEPTCSKDDGFWPGDSCGMNKNDCGASKLPYPCNGPDKYSKFLSDLNADMSQLAQRVFSAWSNADDLIMHHTNTWGKSTCLMPRSTDTKSKEKTYEDQYKWVNRLD